MMDECFCPACRLVIYETFSEISLFIQKHINLSDKPLCYLGALKKSLSRFTGQSNFSLLPSLLRQGNYAAKKTTISLYNKINL
jgi:hypothetical protein